MTKARHLALIAPLLAFGLLAPLSLAAQQPRQGERQRPPPLRSVGEPGRVAAADFGMARQAQEEGQWTALRASLAPGALLHLNDGPVEAAAFLANRADPPQAEARDAKWVWSSCDGTVAVSEGRFRAPDGTVGSYVTVWALQRDRSYKLLYDLRGADVPQPVAPPPPPPPVNDGSVLIVVSEIPNVRGLVADCARRGAPVPGRPSPLSAASSTVRAGEGTADDRTLTWQWEHRANGERLFTARYWRQGAWQQVTQLRLAPTTVP